MRQNVPFHIYELALVFSEVDAGVTFSPNALNAMDLLDPRIRAGFEKHKTGKFSEEKKNTMLTPCMRMDARAGRAGEKVHEHTTGGAGLNNIHKALLLDELVALIPREVACFGKRVVDVVQREEGVKLMATKWMLVPR